MVATRGVQFFRTYMHQTPWLFHVARSARFTAMVGPMRPALVGYHRRFNKNVKLTSNQVSVFDAFDPEAAAAAMERDGYAAVLKLSETYVDRLTEFAGPPSNVVRWNLHKECEAAEQVAHDPALIDVARCYLGTEPIFFGTATWWTIPGSGLQHAHRFHFDVADVKSLSVFIYLTDVDEQCGAHVVIAGTHKKKSLAENLRIYLSEAAAAKKYGDRIKVLTGPRGTGFFEEQTLYHKVLPAARTRLVFTLQYTLARKP